MTNVALDVKQLTFDFPFCGRVTTWTPSGWQKCLSLCYNLMNHW